MAVLTRALALALLLASAALTVACDECAEPIDEAGSFLERPSNLFCQSDAECTGVSTGCHTFSRGLCGQAQLNVNAAMTPEWKRLSEGLNSCDRSCNQCLAAISPHCSDGFCGGKP
jgi:hypothetical protein